ncbi:hypothetical protein tb265_25040 [Gemmatimonadetes bacterium T265]|nr:hypothetical protein tb265_25040 [Gemmatimonadetes bacterium T265]
MCPYTRKFALPLKEAAFAPRPAVAGKDASTLARDLLEMSQPEFSAAFRGSPMKRAKLRGLKRNAAVVLGNVGTAEDVPVLVAALEEPEPLVRAHAAWALGEIGTPGALDALRARAVVELDASVAAELRAALGRVLERRTA